MLSTRLPMLLHFLCQSAFLYKTRPLFIPLPALDVLFMWEMWSEFFRIQICSEGERQENYWAEWEEFVPKNVFFCSAQGTTSSGMCEERKLMGEWDDFRPTEKSWRVGSCCLVVASETGIGGSCQWCVWYVGRRKPGSVSSRICWAFVGICIQGVSSHCSALF